MISLSYIVFIFILEVRTTVSISLHAIRIRITLYNIIYNTIIDNINTTTMTQLQYKNKRVELRKGFWDV